MSSIVPIDLWRIANDPDSVERASEEERNNYAMAHKLQTCDDYPEAIPDIAEHLETTHGWDEDRVDDHMRELAEHEPEAPPPDLDPPLSNARPKTQPRPRVRAFEHDSRTSHEICRDHALSLVELGPGDWAVVGTDVPEIIAQLEIRRTLGVRIAYYASPQDFAEGRPVEFVAALRTLLPHQQRVVLDIESQGRPLDPQ